MNGQAPRHPALQRADQEAAQAMANKQAEIEQARAIAAQENTKAAMLGAMQGGLGQPDRTTVIPPAGEVADALHKGAPKDLIFKSLMNDGLSEQQAIGLIEQASAMAEQSAGIPTEQGLGSF